MTKKIGVIGSEDFVLGFQLAGVRDVIRAEGEEYEPRLNDMLTKGGHGILIVNAKDVSGVSAQMRRKIQASLDPVVVSMGESGGGELREQVKRAIGIDLFKD